VVYERIIFSAKGVLSPGFYTISATELHSSWQLDYSRTITLGLAVK